MLGSGVCSEGVADEQGMVSPGRGREARREEVVWAAAPGGLSVGEAGSVVGTEPLGMSGEEGWTVVSIKNDFGTVFSAVH